ncbi:MAG: hypothetical protein COW60_02210 [Candidatus Yonathbacteria bacterium CG17_big_fil_post_rev_8_21_14_2_50_43_9]|nr:MAG: hypothetical protein COW60_02210 [Candidatus Yonathbacteria bacterium CG17_big_fil_post_rev_8_21_14_2_50_43_9]
MKIFKSLWLLFFAFALVGCSTVKGGGGESAPVSGAAVYTGAGQKTASSGSSNFTAAQRTMVVSRSKSNQ